MEEKLGPICSQIGLALRDLVLATSNSSCWQTRDFRGLGRCCNDILSMEGDENEDVSKFRKHIRDNGISNEALEMAPTGWVMKRHVRHMLENPDDWVGAFRSCQTTCNL